jgi:hypothetical protein
MNNTELNIIYLFTIIIDISFIYIILYQKLNTFDYSYILGVFFMHFLFFISLFTQNRPLIDICHLALMISLGLAVVIKNKYLLILPFLLLMIIPIFWQIFEKCILNTEEQNQDNFFYDTFGITLTHAVFLLIIIISLKLLNIIK